MKRFLSLGLALCLALTLCGAQALAAEPAAQADWTVLIYLCGTDLETDDAMATNNLLEIAKTQPNDRVNLVFQTGGARQWHTADYMNGLDIPSDQLARYHYDEGGFTQDQTLPLANMANAETLTDFIRWGAEAYPADKTMLVLWDHGGGSYGGIICDQLYNSAVMSIEDVGRALQTAGTHFEAVTMDACLMASLEVAQMVKPSASYLIASEETVPSEGSAFTGWLQALYDAPEMDGAAFGKVFCDAYQQKYEAMKTSAETVTFSAIDLSKIDAVSAAFDAMFSYVGALLENPLYFHAFGYDTQRVQAYDAPQMIDLADMAARAKGKSLPEAIAQEVIDAVNSAVVYAVKGSARDFSNGLSFYYSPQAKAEKLDHYARCCQSAPYLAFIDAANMGWSAPEWVYQQTERLPDIRREDYLVELKTTIDETGLPTLSFTNAKDAAANISVQLFSCDEESDLYLSYGIDTGVLSDFDNGVYRYAFDGVWPSIQGFYCQMNVKEDLDEYTLYSIPFIKEALLDEYRTTGFSYEFRAGFVYEQAISQLMAEKATDEAVALSGCFELYGVWDTLDTSTNMPGRDVWDISEFDGDSIVFIRDSINPYTGEQYGVKLTEAATFSSDDPEFELSDLPEGTYGVAFMVKDVFGKEYRSSPVRIEWDGENAVYSMME